MSRMAGMHVPFCVVLGVLLGTAGAQIPDVVLPLNQDNFEHDTQAATGQTTGHWFVLFNTQQHAQHEAASQLWAELALDEDKEVILGEVDLDVKENKALARRFQDIQPPAAVLFRDRKMYIYPESLFAPEAAGKLRQFSKEGYQQTKGQEVPDTASKKAAQADLDRANSVEGNKVVVGLLCLAVGFGLRMYISGKRALAQQREQHQQQQQQRQRQRAAAAADPLAPPKKRS